MYRRYLVPPAMSDLSVEGDEEGARRDGERGGLLLRIPGGVTTAVWAGGLWEAADQSRERQYGRNAG